MFKACASNVRTQFVWWVVSGLDEHPIDSEDAGARLNRLVAGVLVMREMGGDTGMLEALTRVLRLHETFGLVCAC